MSASAPSPSTPVQPKRYAIEQPHPPTTKQRALARVREIHKEQADELAALRMKANEDEKLGLTDSVSDGAVQIEFHAEVARILALGIRAAESEAKIASSNQPGR
jgi:hypothetical protein